MADPPDASPSPLVRDAFDQLADGYDRIGETKPSNAYLERPATLSLVPAVDDDRILDAGCGAGHLAAELTDRGAGVVGVDVSHEMLVHAQDRVPDADFAAADLGSRLPFHESSFDGIVSSLAFHYVENWEPLFRELDRVLHSDGWIVCSVQHPFADFTEYDDAENYHAVERVSATWHAFGETVDVPTYRRPLSAMLDPALRVGFTLDRLVEPTPTDAFLSADPERYAYEATHPNFLCLRFERSG